MDIRQDADSIIKAAISSAIPDKAVENILNHVDLTGELYVVAIGKAAFSMAKVTCNLLKDRIKGGIVITKYGHANGTISPLKVFEAGHPITDENAIAATNEVLSLVRSLGENDRVIFLISGGGSALFESPLISLEALQNVNHILLASGAKINEINTIRKRLSKVKGGKFALECAPAKLTSIILSDVLGDSIDMIASGPSCIDNSTKEDALNIVEKYRIKLPDEIRALLSKETPKSLSNVENFIIGGVHQLCQAAAEKAQELGYRSIILTESLECEAQEAGKFLSAIARTYAGKNETIAFFAGGETVVHLTGKGMGGRNQELVISGAEGIAGLKNVCLFSVSSDGTDGPTDVAGGIVDGDTQTILTTQGISISKVLYDNDSYNALKMCGGLIKTNPTGTNVNDICGLLIKNNM